MVNVLFVCLGNICRSPSAEGIFRKLLEECPEQLTINVDSVGTGGWHIGKPADLRAQKTAKQRGIDLQDLRGRQITEEDFIKNDYIIAMDRSNKSNLLKMCPSYRKTNIHLFLEFTQHYQEEDVPDPYYSGDDGFENVFDMLTATSQGLLEHILQQHAKKRGLLNHG